MYKILKRGARKNVSMRKIGNVHNKICIICHQTIGYHVKKYIKGELHTKSIMKPMFNYKFKMKYIVYRVIKEMGKKIKVNKKQLYNMNGRELTFTLIKSHKPTMHDNIPNCKNMRNILTNMDLKFFLLKKMFDTFIKFIVSGLNSLGSEKVAFLFYFTCTVLSPLMMTYFQSIVDDSTTVKDVFFYNFCVFKSKDFDRIALYYNTKYIYNWFNVSENSIPIPRFSIDVPYFTTSKIVIESVINESYSSPQVDQIKNLKEELSKKNLNNLSFNISIFFDEITVIPQDDCDVLKVSEF